MQANYEESTVPPFDLPPLLVSADGTRIDTRAEWEAHRASLIERYSEAVYGYTPHGEVTTRATHRPDTTPGRRQITLELERDGRRLTVELLVYLPEETTGPVPCFLGLNFGGNQTVDADPTIAKTDNYVVHGDGVVDHRATESSRGVAAHRWQHRTVTGRGYALVTAHCGDFDPDWDDGFANGAHALFQDPQEPVRPDAWGTIGAWAWGLSRILDYLAQVAEIDEHRVVAIGHSRLGKAALWAAAQDGRFAGCVSNCSGCGGAALYRREFGERIDAITSTFPHWFCRNHAEYSGREQELPIDQHMLLSLIAPRMLHVGSAAEDLWADPRGEFLSAVHAGPAYALYDTPPIRAEDWPDLSTAIGSRLRYHRRAGGHNVTAVDWEHYLDHADAELGLAPRGRG